MACERKMSKITCITVLAVLFLSTHVFGGELYKRILVPKGMAIVGTGPTELATQFEGTRARAEWYADETPQRQIEVGAFLIDSIEVTNKRYKKIFPAHKYPSNLENHPVVNVTWTQANDFCVAVSGRLPTENEWERAARGNDGNIYPWGDEFDPGKAVFVESGGAEAKLKVGSFELEESGNTLLGGTRPAGSYPGGASSFGVYDMAGNVWEWVAGYYDKNNALRLLKGGSWLTPQVSLRSATRLFDFDDSRYNDYGFRCAYNPE